MLRIASGIIVCALSMTALRYASAANTVALQSKLVAPGATSVTIGIHVSNDESLFAYAIPLEIRSVTGGAFPTGVLDFTMNPSGRMATAAITGATVERYYPLPAANSCSGPVSNTYLGHTNPDFVSPEGLLWYPIISPCFAAGSDGSTETGTPSMLLTFNVGMSEGVFEIDTCCIQNEHLKFNRCDITPLPVTSFKKSVITVTDVVCNLRPQDVNCDGVIDIFDVVHVVDCAFRNAQPLPPCCEP